MVICVFDRNAEATLADLLRQKVAMSPTKWPIFWSRASEMRSLPPQTIKRWMELDDMEEKERSIIHHMQKNNDYFEIA